MSHDQSISADTPEPLRVLGRKSARDAFLQDATIICNFTEQDAISMGALHPVSGPRRRVDGEAGSNCFSKHVDGIIDRITGAIHADFVADDPSGERLERLMQMVAVRSVVFGSVLQLRELQLDEAHTQSGTTFWLVPNGRGNWTLMYPLDF